MRFTKPQKCDNCKKAYRNLRIRKGKLLCYWCYLKKVHLIMEMNKRLCPRCKKREKADKRCYCEICLKKYQKEYRKNYYLKNKEKIEKRTKEWGKKNPEKIREYQRKYRQKKKDEID